MTTENVTVLFTDLVGSTALQSSVDPEAADELRRGHFTLLRQAIADAGGREVKNLGDGLMVVFPTASAAIGCAAAMQQSMDLDERRGGGVPSLRVGLSGGEVTLEDDDYFGDPVIEAARLCATCTGGQVLAAAQVALTAGRRNPHPTRAIGPLSLKGLPEPIEVVEVLWEPLEDAAADDSSLPGLLTERGRFPFAGREKEAELLVGAFATASTGAARLVLVAGEPGIGKTRLTSQLATHVLGAGGLVLAGRSDELVSAPYQPFAEALRWRMAQAGGVDALGSMPGELVRLVPELAQVVPNLDPPLASSPEAERLVLFAAVRDWLTSVATAQPVLLVLDDLHWADMGSLLLLRHVIANDPVPGLLVVATYRDTDLDRTHPLSNVLAEFHRRGDVERIALRGLDEREVTALVTLTAGHDLDEAAINLAADLTEDTGGNPFFVGEVLRHLAQSGVITQDDGRWVAARGGDDAYLPEGIRQVVGRRLSALPDDTQKLLSSASVIGARFDLDLLATISGDSPDDALDAIEPAIDAHLVLEVGIGRYQFAHALVRSTLHGELSTTRRARLHQAVAQALETAHAADLDAVMGELAYHWGETGAASLNDAAFTYARRAAELASERAAPDDAVRWYRIARERLDGQDPALDAVLLCQLGLAEWLTGEPRWQDTLFEAARAAEAVGDASTMTAALSVDRRHGATANLGEPNPAREALLRRALDRPDLTVAQRGRLMLALSNEVQYAGDLEQRRRLYLEAMTFVDQLTDPIEWIRTVEGLNGSIPFGFADRPFWEASNTRARAAQRLAHERADRDAERESLDRLQWGSLFLGQPDFEDILADQEALLAVFPSPLLLESVLHRRSTLAIIQGRFPLARRLYGDLADAGEAGRLIDLQSLRETRGLDLSIELLSAHPLIEAERGYPGAITGLLASALAESGRLDDAAALVAQAGRQGFARMDDDGSLPVARSCWTEAAVLVEDTSACEALYELLLPYHDIHQVTGWWYAGSTARYLGLLAATLGNDEDADRWFAQAIDAHRRIGSPPWTARTLIDWGERLLARGQVSRARELTQEALDQIGSLELTISRDRANALLAASD